MDIDAIRKQFPILEREVQGKPLVYLDNAASTQCPRRVIDAISAYLSSSHANVHRGVHSLSQEATALLESCRDRLQAFLGAEQREQIILTHGATEALNMVAFGWGRERLCEGDEILVSELEHHANFVPWQQVARETGAVVRRLPMDLEAQGITLEGLGAALSPRTRVVAIAHVSNVLGSVAPLAGIVEAAHEAGAIVVVDGAQSAPHMPLDLHALDVDFFACSGHKMCGPTGVGVLYGKVAQLEALRPLCYGGAMVQQVGWDETRLQPLPHRLEAGTPPILSAIGLSAAIECLQAWGMEAIEARERALMEYARATLSQLPELVLLGPEQPVGALSFALGDAHPYDVGQLLDLEGVAIRTGHHCAQPLMQRLGRPGTCRASFAFYNTFQEIDALAQALESARRFLAS